MQTQTVMLCGVGGQGTILAADLLAKTAAKSGFAVKLSEVHGMAQRGGSVNTVVRFGDVVSSPVADPGTCDALVAFEYLESARYIHFLKPAGKLLVNEARIDPLVVRSGNAQFPDSISETLAAFKPVMLNATQVALDVGAPRSANVVLVGALSAVLPFKESVWIDVITNRVPPKTIDANLAAFKAGRSLAGVDNV